MKTRYHISMLLFVAAFHASAGPYDASIEATPEYSNSTRVVEVINLKTNYSAAIVKSREVFGLNDSASIWDHARRTYIEMLTVQMSNDELLEKDSRNKRPFL